MRREIAPCQQCSVNRGVKRLDAAVEQLGKARDLANLRDRNPGTSQGSRGSPSGDDFPAQLAQRLGKGHDPSLVAYGDQRPRHGTVWSRESGVGRS
jgi:hypothetical protein